MQEEPLGSTDRAAFSCGDENVDAYFTGKRIRYDLENYEAAAFVLKAPNGVIASFYTLSNASVVKSRFSRTEQKRHLYEFTPATLIGYLGVDAKFQGRGIGRKTISHALRRSYDASRQTASAVVLVDVEVSNDKAKNLYTEAQFKELEKISSKGGHELLRLWLPMRRLVPS